jgi:hypothetical protein
VCYVLVQEFANAQWLSAVHITGKWCMHNNNAFLTVHSTFMHWAETMLKMIDPDIVLPYWDNMVSRFTHRKDHA